MFHRSKLYFKAENFRENVYDALGSMSGQRPSQLMAWSQRSSFD